MSQFFAIMDPPQDGRTIPASIRARPPRPRVLSAEPVSQRVRRQQILDVVEYAKAHPGVWLLVEEDASPNASFKYTKRGLTARHVKTGDQKHDIYVVFAE